MVQRRENIGLIVLAVGAGMTLMLGGVAAMLWVTTGVAHWLLWAIPLAPTGIAAMIFFYPVAIHRMDITASVREQLDKDLELFKELL